MTPPNTAAVVLAAGRGTRMNSDLPKVLHTVLGKPMLDWVLAALEPLPIVGTWVVTGFGGAEIEASLPAGIEFCRQQPQAGSGHAVQVAREHLPPHTQSVLVLAGDMPLVTSATLTELLQAHQDRKAQVTVLSTHKEDPYGYGRIIRTTDGQVLGIVEQKETTPEQAQITEVNTGIYCFSNAVIQAAFDQLPVHSDGEKYLTDVVEWARQAGLTVQAHLSSQPGLDGVNNMTQLAQTNQLARRQIIETLMSDGVRVWDPDQTYVEPQVRIASGVTIQPGCYLRGDTNIGPGASIGPNVDMSDSQIGAHAQIRYSVLEQAVVGKRAVVGPFSFLRPGTVLEEGAKTGAFVEIKASRIGASAKVPHLSYIGDAEIGSGANIGAGSITCNYDGESKHRTIIGADSFIGSDTMLVAPVEIGAGAWTGAGSVISHNVDPGALAIERGKQRQIENYAQRRRHRSAPNPNTTEPPPTSEHGSES